MKNRIGLNNSLGLALTKALGNSEESGGNSTAVEIAAAPKDTTAWSTPDIQTHDCMQWENGLFGKLRIKAKEFPLMDFQHTNTSCLTRVAVPVVFQPDRVIVDMSYQARSDVRVLHYADGKVTELKSGGIPDLMVRVTWDDESRPHTREKGKDNIDLFFVRNDATFVQIQISLVTRGGTFWICAQVIHSGQVVEGSLEEIQELGRNHIVSKEGDKACTIVPLFPESAYYGEDYVRAFGNESLAVIKLLKSWGNAFAPLRDCMVAEWSPVFPELTQDQVIDRWQPAVILYFNLVLGCGLALCEDGVECRVHFKQILDVDGVEIWTKRDECPMLEPMKGILVKYAGNDRRQAAKIMKVE